MKKSSKEQFKLSKLMPSFTTKLYLFEINYLIEQCNPARSSSHVQFLVKILKGTNRPLTVSLALFAYKSDPGPF